MRNSISPPEQFKVGICRTLTRDQRSWGRIKADLVRRTGLTREETSASSPQHVFVFNLRGSSDQGQYVLDGKQRAFVRRRPGAMLFIPAGCNLRGWESGAASAAYLSIRVDPDLVTDLLDQSVKTSNLSFAPDLGFEDHVLANSARGLGAEIHDSSALSNMLVESYVGTMLAQLLRRQRSVSFAPKSGGLSPANLNRVIAKIEDELDEELTLTQLSELVDLSIPHFCRAFKQSVGCPPYTFIMRRRIDRAKEFLRHSEMPITAIALSCGFSHSSHFANAFRREMGMSPAAFRAI